MKQSRKIFLWILLTILSNSAFSKNIIIYSNPDQNIKISNKVEILEDTEGKMSIQEIISSRDFKKSLEAIPNLQISSSTFWIKFEIKNNTKQDDIVLELQYPIIDEVTLYRILPTGNYSIEKSGEYVPYYNRKYKYQDYIFDLNIPENETRTFIMKIKGSEQIQLPLTIGPSKGILESLFTKDLIFGLYAGIIIVMFLYNLFVYFVVKDKTYLFYVGYILSVGLTQACLQGYSSRFFWPDSAFLANQSMIFSPSLAGIGALLFVNSFLQVKIHTPTLFKISYGIIVLYTIAILLGLFEMYHVSQQIVQMCSMMGSILVFIIAYKIIKKGFREAKFFLIAWSIFLASVIIFVLRNFDFLPYNNFTYYALQFGSGLEVVLLSLALGDRINILKKEKEESQAQALDALLQNELIIRNQNIVLENRVEERTKKLKDINQELSTTLSELKQTQSHLVNAEKMASLGQLTAGIAHEINNPINFVVSNVKPLQRDIEEIYELINKYDKINIDESNTNEKILGVRKYREEIDYEYLKQEIGHMLKGIEDGAVRTADIVKGLRVFSRLDENDLKRTDITEGINATLTLLNPEISGSIELVKNFTNIPKIECFPGKLNQVFMNILNNAIYAIKENKNRSEKGKLIITTSYDDSFVYISIKDNGIGMNDESKRKIFDPFFTTKPVGKGTGLGMSITFSIINDHHGNIDLHSEYEKGTEFIIKLPIEYAKK